MCLRLKNRPSAYKKQKGRWRALDRYGKDAQKALKCWSDAAEMYPAGVGSGEFSLLVAAHTAGDTSVCSEKFRRRERSFLHQHSFFLLRWLGETPCKKKNNKKSEKFFRSYHWGGTVRKTLPTTLIPHRDYQLQENHCRLQQPGEIGPCAK